MQIKIILLIRSDRNGVDIYINFKKAQIFENTILRLKKIYPIFLNANLIVDFLKV